MKNKLAIFDLDGTLFDTKDVNYYSYKQAMEKCGYNFPYEYFENKCYGRYYKEFLPELLENNEEIMEKVHNMKKELYKDNLNKAKMNEHIFNIIESIKDNYYIALYTTASEKNTKQILKEFNKLEEFDYILTNEMIENKKPHPEGYCKIMEYYNIKPEDTMIFEDSKVGIEAARRSKANVFIVDKF